VRHFGAPLLRCNSPPSGVSQGRLRPSIVRIGEFAELQRACCRALGESSSSRGIRDPESVSELRWKTRRLRPDGLFYRRFPLLIRPERRNGLNYCGFSVTAGHIRGMRVLRTCDGSALRSRPRRIYSALVASGQSHIADKPSTSITKSRGRGWIADNSSTEVIRAEDAVGITRPED
jgi:hypothetical protein